jgi:hypothetical protein
MVGEIVENHCMIGNRDQNLGKSERYVRLETTQDRRIEAVRDRRPAQQDGNITVTRRGKDIVTSHGREG